MNSPTTGGPGPTPCHRAGATVKRMIDMAGAGIGLVVLSPIILWAAVAVLATMGRPILFRQTRPGLDGAPFTILKFRTMRPPRAGEVWYDSDSARVTRVGRILRSTSIDELPELWNVLRGDMSLVGPRPLLTEYLARYTAHEMRRHEMRPGLTGLAAVRGRHTRRFEERLELDVWYVDNWSLLLDMRIILMTLREVLGREGVRSVQDMGEIDFPERFEASLAEARQDAGQAGASDRRAS